MQTTVTFRAPDGRTETVSMDELKKLRALAQSEFEAKQAAYINAANVALETKLAMETIASLVNKLDEALTAARQAPQHCRHCGRNLGNDAQALSLGYCSGICATAGPSRVACSHCGQMVSAEFALYVDDVPYCGNKCAGLNPKCAKCGKEVPANCVRYHDGKVYCGGGCKP